MEVRLGYGNNLAAHTVCKLKKALYGLKQSPRTRFGRFVRAKGIIHYSLNTHLKGESQPSRYMSMI
jgi:hypothetical protein